MTTLSGRRGRVVVLCPSIRKSGEDKVIMCPSAREGSPLLLYAPAAKKESKKERKKEKIQYERLQKGQNWAMRQMVYNKKGVFIL